MSLEIMVTDAILFRPEAREAIRESLTNSGFTEFVDFGCMDTCLYLHQWWDIDGVEAMLKKLSEAGYLQPCNVLVVPDDGGEAWFYVIEDNALHQAGAVPAESRPVEWEEWELEKHKQLFNPDLPPLEASEGGGYE